MSSGSPTRPHRDASGAELAVCTPGIVEVAGDLDQAGRDGVDADAARRKLDRELTSEGDDGALGGGVGGVAGNAAPAVHGRDVDDGAVAGASRYSCGPWAQKK